MSDKETYRDNPLLKRVGVKYNFTQEEIAEYIKCSQDAVYLCILEPLLIKIYRHIYKKTNCYEKNSKTN